jgi:hypothetical protein
MRTFTAVALSALLVWSARGSRAETVAVPSTSNIYGAGHSGGAATPQPAGGGGGTAPPSIDVLTTAQFGFAGSGSVRFSPSNPVSNNPDGPATASTTFLSFNGVSGFDSDHAFALYGVFVGATEPADPPPPALSFTGNTSFANLSPQLDQVFYIGDGLTGTGSGSTQLFNVPTGALKLYFGLADGVEQSPNVIKNGFYGDNSGAYSVDVSRFVTPEPGDYNDDHKVDAADYVLWRKSPNTYGGNPAGYNTWRANFGQPPGRGLGTAASASAVVPEPTATFLLLSTVAGLSFLRRSAALSSQKVIRI